MFLEQLYIELFKYVRSRCTNQCLYFVFLRITNSFQAGSLSSRLTSQDILSAFTASCTGSVAKCFCSAGFQILSRQLVVVYWYHFLFWWVSICICVFYNMLFNQIEMILLSELTQLTSNTQADAIRWLKVGSDELPSRAQGEEHIAMLQDIAK